MLCVADHFEPAWNEATYEQECQRVQKWLQLYPKLASKHADADGVRPQHTFFYPEEQYRPEHLDALATLCRSGFGDVEIHLHHDRDTAEGLREKLLRFKTILHEKHRLLRANLHTGEIEYGFIHGDWALDNSNPDGTCCGVNNELTVLRETGCYADFTLPSYPSPTQTRKINCIYYASDDPLRPKSHDTGIDVSSLDPPSGDLMIVQGPLALNWKSRKWGVLPKIENGELSGDNPPASKRIDLWIRQHICVRGRPNWIFVKLHTHGATEKNSEVLLGRSLDEMWSYLEGAYNDGIRYRLHYVSARQAYNIIKAAEAGHDGNPHEFRNFGETQSKIREVMPVSRHNDPKLLTEDAPHARLSSPRSGTKHELKLSRRVVNPITIGILKFKGYLRKHGLVRTLWHCVVYVSWQVEDRIPSVHRMKAREMEFDRKFGVTTHETVQLSDLGIRDSKSNHYAATPVGAVETILKTMQITYEEFVFIDLGAGKGRALFMASEFPFKKIIGVEFSPDLARIGEENVANYRSATQECKDIVMLRMDATQFRLPIDKIVLYMYNPFKKKVMAAVLKNLEESLRSSPREVFVIYYNPVYSRLLRETGYLKEILSERGSWLRRRYAVFRTV